MDSKISTCKYEVQDHFVTIVQEQQEKHIHLPKVFSADDTTQTISKLLRCGNCYSRHDARKSSRKIE